MSKKLFENNTEISRYSKFDKNPRRITKRGFELLKDHIETLGDLSGVIYCHNAKMYVGGNQRSEVFDGDKIEIVERYDQPTDKKTIAYGFIIHNGEKYAYREVLYTDYEFRMACIVANNDGGENDWDELANSWDAQELEEWGLYVPQEEEDIEEEERPAKQEDTGIIAITLTDDEQELWAECKAKLKIKTDKTTFLKLITNFLTPAE